MILVDSTVWIDFFRGAPARECDVLADLIAHERDIAICGVIRQEVLQGVRDDESSRRIRALFSQAHYVALVEPDHFDHAAALYRSMRRAGVTLRAPMDCLIAVLTMHARATLLHHDRDFQLIAQHSALKTFESGHYSISS
ncbi:MAG: PIN domain nuclease [Deltaproteobacteria bacterium]|nr:PIN domain nuclease [Deltaproteobacteria bacterium]